MYWLLGSSVQKMSCETEKDLHSLLANTGRLVYNQTSSPASSCSNDTILIGWRSFLYGWYIDQSSAIEGWLLGGALFSLCSLEQTAPDLIAAGHPH